MQVEAVTQVEATMQVEAVTQVEAIMYMTHKLKKDAMEEIVVSVKPCYTAVKSSTEKVSLGHLDEKGVSETRRTAYYVVRIVSPVVCTVEMLKQLVDLNQLRDTEQYFAVATGTIVYIYIHAIASQVGNLKTFRALRPEDVVTYYTFVKGGKITQKVCPLLLSLYNHASLVIATLVVHSKVIEKISFRDACAFVHDWTPTQWTYNMGQAKIDVRDSHSANMYILFYVARLYVCSIARLSLWTTIF
jgi:hypothetical protein